MCYFINLIMFFAALSCIGDNISDNKTSIATIQSQLASLIHEVEGIKEKQKEAQEKPTLQKSTSHITQAVQEKANALKAELLNSIKHERMPWKFRTIEAYFSNIISTLEFFQVDQRARKILFHSGMLIVLSLFTAFVVSFGISKILKLSLPNHTFINTSKIITPLLNTIIYPLTIYVVGINKAMLPGALAVVLGLNSMILLRNLALYYYNQHQQNFHHQNAFMNQNSYQSILWFLLINIFFLVLNYSFYCWVGLIKTTTTDFRGMIHLQTLIFSFSLSCFILIIKKHINQFIKTTIGLQKTITTNIIALWHWVLILIISMLTITWTMETNQVSVVLSILLTIFFIPFTFILTRNLRAKILKQIRTYPQSQKQILFTWYLRTKKYIVMHAILLQIYILSYIWNIDIFGTAKTVLTVNAVNSIINVFIVFTSFKLLRFLIDYWSLVLQKQRPTKTEKMLKIMRVGLIALLHILLIFALIIALGYNPVPLISSLGFLTFGLSLGAQTIIRDMFYGFLFVLDSSILLGDSVVLDGNSGIKKMC